MVSMFYKGRPPPLLWVTRKGKKGHFPQEMHIERIKSVQAIIPEGTAAICLGDGKFDGADWLGVCLPNGNNAILYENGDEFTFTDISPEQEGMTEISAAEFTQSTQGLACLMANLPRLSSKVSVILNSTSIAKSSSP